MNVCLTVKYVCVFSFLTDKILVSLNNLLYSESFKSNISYLVQFKDLQSNLSCITKESLNGKRRGVRLNMSGRAEISNLPFVTTVRVE